MLASASETTTQPASADVSENSYVAHLQQRRRARAIGDEWSLYLSTPPIIDCHDSRTWWLEATQKKAFPTLGMMALDMLSIPSESADPERLFSSCKLQITDQRNKLGIDTIEALESLKSWLNLPNWVEDEDLIRSPWF